MNFGDTTALTEAVIGRFANTPDARLKTIMTSLVLHLHDFARQVQLTESEWLQAVQFLTETGHACQDGRQEFVLLSDVLGLSMLTVEMNQQMPKGCTEATVLGPFFVQDAPQYALGDDVAHGASGAPCFVSGTIKALDGSPIAHARMDVWQADDQGEYDVQKLDLDRAQARGVLHADDQGRFHFKTILAEPYPIPTDGPVGQLLKATCRSPWRPAHLHFKIQAPGYQTLITHVFRRGDPYLDSDPVLGVRQSLIADWSQQPDGTTRLVFDFVLNRQL